MPTFSQFYNLQEQERADRERFQRGQTSRRARTQGAEQGTMLALRRALETQETQQQALKTTLANRAAEQQRRDLLSGMEEPGVTLTSRTRPPAGEVIARYGQASPGATITEEELSGGVFPTPGGGKRLVLRGKKPTKDEMEAILERRGGLGQIEDARRRALGLRPFEETSPENRVLMKRYMDLGRKKTAEAREAGLIAGEGFTPEQAARRVVMEDRESRGVPQRPGDVAAMQGEAAQQESAAERIRKMQEEAAPELASAEIERVRAEKKEREHQAGVRRQKELEELGGKLIPAQFKKRWEEELGRRRALRFYEKKAKIAAEYRPERVPQRMRLQDTLYETKTLMRLLDARVRFDQAHASGDPRRIAEAEREILGVAAAAPEDFRAATQSQLHARLQALQDQTETLKESFRYEHPLRGAKPREMQELLMAETMGDPMTDEERQRLDAWVASQ